MNVKIGVEKGSLTMNDGLSTFHRDALIVNAHGLHMRPSTRFVNLATTFSSEVWVSFNGTRVNGKSILDMTMLAAECGSTLKLEAIGSDSEQAINALAELVAAGFHMGDE